MIPFKVLCLNDSERPESIPTSAWIKQGRIYTVIKVDRMRMQNGALGYKLSEVNLDPYFPYQYFGAWRFGVLVDDLEATDELEEIIEKLEAEAEKEELGLVEIA